MQLTNAYNNISSKIVTYKKQINNYKLYTTNKAEKLFQINKQKLKDYKIKST